VKGIRTYDACTFVGFVENNVFMVPIPSGANNHASGLRCVIGWMGFGVPSVGTSFGPWPVTRNRTCG